jgi:hypothetical protein
VIEAVATEVETPPDPAPEVEPAAPSHPDPADQGARSGSALPFVVLAVVVVALGAGAVYLVRSQPADNSDEIARLTAQIESLSAAVEAGKGDDPAAGAVAQLEQNLGATLGNLSSQIVALDNRMNTLEERPPDDAPVEFAEIVAGLRADLAALRAENAQLAAQLDSQAQSNATLAAENAELSAQIDVVQGELALARDVQSASHSERLAGPLAQIKAALVTGQGFAAAAESYSEVTGNELPADLMAVASGGVATVASLQADFPPAARAALAAALQAGEGGNIATRAIDFLRAQVGARSITPREGDDADAVLSRAQAAVDAGKIAAAEAQLAALPEAALPHMAAWRSRANRRIGAIAAYRQLAGGF